MIGFSNGTFSLDAEEDDEYAGGEIRWRDALFTTPATLLIYYGVLMLTTAIFGCFAGAGGRRCCNITVKWPPAFYSHGVHVKGSFFCCSFVISSSS